MNDYIIVDVKTGKFVAAAGSYSSFTKDICKARKFSSYEDAKANKCPIGEIVAKVSDYI